MMIIGKKTAAETQQREFRHGLPVTIKVAGALLAQTIAVNEVDDEGAVLPLHDSAGAEVFLTATSQPLEITSPITLQFVKGVTTNACGVQANGGA